MTSNKRGEFLERTLKLVYEKGFRATTMRDIAKHSNFEVPNVYNYIDSKEAFLEEHLFNIIIPFHGYLDQIMESSCSPREKLKFIISKHVQFSIDRPYEVALFVYDWRNLSEPKLSEFKGLREAYLEKVGSILETGMEEGQFRKMDVKFGTFLFFSSLRWLFNVVVNQEVKPNPIELDKQIADYIFYGIGIDHSD